MMAMHRFASRSSLRCQAYLWRFVAARCVAAGGLCEAVGTGAGIGVGRSGVDTEGDGSRYGGRCDVDAQVVEPRGDPDPVQGSAELRVSREVDDLAGRRGTQLDWGGGAFQVIV